MPIIGWISCVFIGLVVMCLGFALVKHDITSYAKAFVLSLCVLTTIILFCVATTLDSTICELENHNDIPQTVTVYTSTGYAVATYSGEVDMEMLDDGYVQIDFDGNRYIYYNCYIETVSSID